MIQYLVILLDDTAPSYCHYDNPKTERKLMPLETLQRAVRYAMVENLAVQFVYPDYELPAEYLSVIDEIDHSDIVSAAYGAATLLSPSKEKETVFVTTGFSSLNVLGETLGETATGVSPLHKPLVVLRCTRAELFAHYPLIPKTLEQCTRLNVIITDVEKFTEEDFAAYKDVLEALSKSVEELYLKGLSPQLNLLTDRMMLDKMNNCGAADTCVTLAPDGKFYPCPAFYLAPDGYNIGSLVEGLQIKNPQLYRLDHAPICRKCNAWHCKRCVWLNRKTTLEVNTPSHEQCVVSHLERNASRTLLTNIRKHGTFLPDREEIKELTYLDPYDIAKRW